MWESKINYEAEIHQVLFKYESLVDKLQNSKYLNTEDKDDLLNAIWYIRQLNVFNELTF